MRFRGVEAWSIYMGLKAGISFDWRFRKLVAHILSCCKSVCYYFTDVWPWSRNTFPDGEHCRLPLISYGYSHQIYQLRACCNNAFEMIFFHRSWGYCCSIFAILASLFISRSVFNLFISNWRKTVHKRTAQRSKSYSTRPRDITYNNAVYIEYVCYAVTCDGMYVRMYDTIAVFVVVDIVPASNVSNKKTIISLSYNGHISVLALSTSLFCILHFCLRNCIFPVYSVPKDCSSQGRVNFIARWSRGTSLLVFSGSTQLKKTSIC